MRIWILQPDYVIVANTFELELKCHKPSGNWRDQDSSFGHETDWRVAATRNHDSTHALHPEDAS